MKTLFTLVLLAFLTCTLTAQTSTFESAKSLVNENAVASLNFDLAAMPAVADREEAEELEEVENHFNIKCAPNAIFNDVKIFFNVATATDVTVEVLRAGTVVFATTETLNAGAQKVLWNQGITKGTHTIRVIANNKVEAKRITLR